MNTTVPSLHLLPAPFRTLQEGVRLDPADFPGCASLKSVRGGEVEERWKTQFCCFRSAESLTVVFSASGASTSGPSALIAPEETLRTPGLWEVSEVVEVFVAVEARTRGRYREYEVAPDGRWIALDVHAEVSGIRGDQDCPTAFRCAVASHKGGWRAALEIPWRELGGDVRGLQANFFRSIPGSGTEGLFAWSPTGTGAHCFHRPERFGELL